MRTEAIVEAIGDFLDDDDWKYEYRGEKKLFVMGVGLKCRMQSARLYIDVKDDAYLVYAISPISGSEETSSELMRYLTRANYALINGNFELDVRDGEVRYKSYVNCDSLSELPAAIIRDSIYVPCAMMNKYGDGIAAIAMGYSDADTEIKKAENGSFGALFDSGDDDEDDD